MLLRVGAERGPEAFALACVLAAAARLPGPRRRRALLRAAADAARAATPDERRDRLLELLADAEAVEAADRRRTAACGFGALRPFPPLFLSGPR